MYHTFLVGIGQKNASHHRGKEVKCFISELCRCLQYAKRKKDEQQAQAARSEPGLTDKGRGK